MVVGAPARSVAGMSIGQGSSPADVVILGGGVAGLEAMMALHELAAERVRVTLVAAEEELVENGR